jgi:hypothetical protein
MSKKRDVAADDPIMVIGIVVMCVITWAVGALFG